MIQKTILYGSLSKSFQLALSPQAFLQFCGLKSVKGMCAISVDKWGKIKYNKFTKHDQ